METATELMGTETQSGMGTETPSTVETVAPLSPEEIAELQEFKKNKAFFQSKFDSKLSEVQKTALEEKIKAEMLEKELNSLKNPKPVERQLIEPVEPIQPSDYDDIEALTKGTSSYDYAQKYKRYVKELASYSKEVALRQGREMEEKLKPYIEIVEQEKKRNEFFQFQANLARELQAEGMDEVSAKKASVFFTTQDSGDRKILKQMWESLNKTPTKETYTAPPTPSGAGSGTINSSEFTKNADKSWMYKTKK